MREAIMSSGLFVAKTVASERARPENKSVKQAKGWNLADFAREQIRGLVRQVSFSNTEPPVRQVVFSAAEGETDVQNLCWRVGETLALETSASIALAGEYPQNAETYAEEMTEPRVEDGSSRLRQPATRVSGSFWLVPSAGKERDAMTTAWLHSYMGGIRSQFEYSIVVAPPATGSNATMAMAQLADGIVLVLSAHHTRRIAARKIKEKLEGAQARLLGTVLSDRVFPIPERIYRNL